MQIFNNLYTIIVDKFLPAVITPIITAISTLTDTFSFSAESSKLWGSTSPSEAISYTLIMILDIM